MGNPRLLHKMLQHSLHSSKVILILHIPGVSISISGGFAGSDSVLLWLNCPLSGRLGGRGGLAGVIWNISYRLMLHWSTVGFQIKNLKSQWTLTHVKAVFSVFGKNLQNVCIHVCYIEKSGLGLHHPWIQLLPPMSVVETIDSVLSACVCGCGFVAPLQRSSAMLCTSELHCAQCTRGT